MVYHLRAILRITVTRVRTIAKNILDPNQTHMDVAIPMDLIWFGGLFGTCTKKCLVISWNVS